MRKLSLAAVAACLCMISGAPANAGADVDGEALLQAFLDDVQTFRARFAQTLVDADDNIVEESAGTLEISRPGRFRWSYETPYEQLLVADGLNVWSYDADLLQVTVKPQADVLGNTPALLLGGASEALRDFELAESFMDRGTAWIRLKPRDSEAGFEAVDLGFTDGTLSRMIFMDRLGQSTLVALHDVEVNPVITAERFQFETPDGADIVGTPAESP